MWHTITVWLIRKWTSSNFKKSLFDFNDFFKNFFQKRLRTTYCFSNPIKIIHSVLKSLCNCSRRSPRPSGQLQKITGYPWVNFSEIWTTFWPNNWSVDQDIFDKSLSTTYCQRLLNNLFTTKENTFYGTLHALHLTRLDLPRRCLVEKALDNTWYTRLSKFVKIIL